MQDAERRKPANATLRAKVARIQAAHQQLNDAVRQSQAQTLAWVRQTHSPDLPAAQLAPQLSPLFAQQHAAIERMQKETLGVTAAATRHEPVVTDDELRALLK